MIRVNQRGYGTSTFYTNEELAVLGTDPSLFVEKRIVEYADFLHHIIKKENLRDGSVILANWSIGYVSAAGLLKFSNKLDQEHMKSIAGAVKRIVMLDGPSDIVLSQPGPDMAKLGGVFAVDPAKFVRDFSDWVVSDFERGPTPDHPDKHWAGKFQRNFTTKSQEMLEKTQCPSMGTIVLMLAWPPNSPDIPLQTEAILFPGDTCHPAVDMSDWAKSVELWWIWATKSEEECCVAGIFMENNKRGRLTTVKRIEGNHFFAYVHPEETWRVLVSN